MRRARLILLVAMLLACVAAHPAPPRAPALAPGGGSDAPTIEPTLPLRIDLTASDLQWSGRAGAARIELSLLPDAGIPEVVLDFRLPEDLSAEGETPPSRLAALAAGERLHYVVPVRAAHAGLFAIRVEAELHLEDGRSVRAGQGLDLRLGVAGPQGRSNAGAYEFMGVPVAEPAP